jgi:steroid 5-alpha reductase family enzyme
MLRRRCRAEEPMSEAAGHAAAPDGGDRTRAFLWIAVAYLVAMVVALVTGIACGERHPIAVAFAADVAATLAIFAFSFAFGNSSFYDAYWSVAPPLVALWFVVAPGSEGVATRRGLVVALVLLWALRLTHNWARGWSGLDHEDWRYVELRSKAGRIGYWFVSLLGLHGMPTAIVFLGLLPLWPALASGTRPLGWLDGVAATVTLAGVSFEFFADNTLRRFRLSDPPPGAILEGGLWAWSRNPNYLGEMLFWFGLALFSLAAAGFVWWAWLGAPAMVGMFLGTSIPMKEARMLARRPAYAERQRRVSLVIPRPPKQRR